MHIFLDIVGLPQDCSNSSVLAIELLESCAKQSINSVEMIISIPLRLLWSVRSHFWICINTLKSRQDGHHFPDDIFRCIFLNENEWYSIKVSLKFVPKVPINSIPALLQIMAWRQPGSKLLSEPMMVSLPMHICVTRPQWVNQIGKHCINDCRNINKMLDPKRHPTHCPNRRAMQCLFWIFF